MNKGFWAIPKNIAIRKGLSFRAKLIAGVLWTRKDKTNMSYPSRRYIANMLGVSVDTVDRGIKELKEKTGLQVIRKGLRKNNRYIMPDWNSELTDLLTLDPVTMPVQDSANLQSPIVRDNQKENTVVDDQSSIKEIIIFFKQKVQKIKGYTPEINWSKDVVLINQKLKNHNSEQLKNLINWYLQSQHSQRLGDSLSICLSVNIMNLWKASKVSSEFYLSKLYPSFNKP